MTGPITALQVLDMLDGAVKRQGLDFKYRKPEPPPSVQKEIAEAADVSEFEAESHWWNEADCLYFHDIDQPGCIVGNVMHAEFDVHEVLGMEGQGAQSVFTDATGVELTELAGVILGRAQHHQDMGETWGATMELVHAEFDKAAWAEVP